VPLVPKDATLVHFTEKEGCNIDEDSILEALIAKIARIKFENEAKEAWTTNRNGIFWHSDSKKVSKNMKILKNFEISSNYRLNPNEADSKEELELVCDVLKSNCSKDRVGYF